MFAAPALKVVANAASVNDASCFFNFMKRAP
jgi:hypothetical protein